MTIFDAMNMSALEAEDCEQQLKVNPIDLVSRLRLLGYYHPSTEEKSRLYRPAWHRQVLWFIRHRPHSPGAISFCNLDPFADDQAHTEARQIWEAHAAIPDQHPTILHWAASFIQEYDLPRAERIWRTKKLLAPSDPAACDTLANLYLRQAYHYRYLGGHEHLQQAVAWFRKAFIELEEGYKLTTDEQRRFHRLGKLAHTAFFGARFEAAERYGRVQLDLLNAFEARGENCGSETFEAHDVLGLLALRRGDLDLAAEHLIESTRTTASPSLDTFGPSLLLAKELIDHGKTDAVICFLKQCRSFWDNVERLDTWIEEIRQTGNCCWAGAIIASTLPATLGTGEEPVARWLTSDEAPNLGS